MRSPLGAMHATLAAARAYMAAYQEVCAAESVELRMYTRRDSAILWPEHIAAPFTSCYRVHNGKPVAGAGPASSRVHNQGNERPAI